MTQPVRGSSCVFGYVTAVESADYGYFGGYLIVSQLGRPLEFHCTAPIRPSRAQQILYGPTLEPYLLGEQIGGTLLRSAKIIPNVVLTNSEALLHARELIDVPMALVVAANEPGNRLTSNEIAFGPHRLLVPLGYEQDETKITSAISSLTSRFDLVEPFGRIQGAILEAQRLGGSGNEIHEQAA